jgi:protease I
MDRRRRRGADRTFVAMDQKSLKGVRVAVLAVDGFEQVEVTMPVAALRRAGADVRLLSLRPGRIRGMNFIFRGRKLPVDDTIEHARVEDYSALLLPGGFVNPDLLRQSTKVKEFVRAFNESGRPIATLCHGPEVLISAGIVRGRRLASWPGIADDVRNAGGDWQDEKVVRDENWVSSRSPLDLASFVPAMIKLFEERAPLAEKRLPRQMRWGAWVSRALTWGAIPLAVVAARAARQGARKKREVGASWLAPAVLSFAGLTALRQLGRLRSPRLTSAVSKGYGRAGYGHLRKAAQEAGTEQQTAT